jgi:hypothetical protein
MTMSNSTTNTTTTTTIPISRSTIDDFREIIREQAFITPTNSLDLSIKRYSPIPSISTSETCLIPKRQIFNHFAPTQRAQLPSLSKRSMLPTMSNVMDLDEDLPQCNINIAHRAATYTSPGDRIISPIKRPSAPSPPTSAQIKRLGQTAFINDDDDDEEDSQRCFGLTDDDSQLFNENFYHYHQPIIMTNHRIDHYNHNNPHRQLIEKHPTIIINDGHDELLHSLDFQS